METVSGFQQVKRPKPGTQHQKNICAGHTRLTSPVTRRPTDAWRQQRPTHFRKGKSLFTRGTSPANLLSGLTLILTIQYGPYTQNILYNLVKCFI